MNAWALLGIEPTADREAIRRAYARRLKTTRPESDPEAFQRLHAARASALSEAARMVRTPVGDDPIDVETTDPPPPVHDGAVGSERQASEEDVGDPAIPSAQAVRPRVVEIAAIEALESHWSDAARLQPALSDVMAPLSSGPGPVDTAAFTALVRTAAGLPRGPRREVEKECIAKLCSGLRKSDGAFDPRHAIRVRPLLVIAEDAFGWCADDEILTSQLPPRDAAAVTLLLLENARTYPVHRLARRPQMSSTDLDAYFAEWPSYADLKNELATGVPVRVRVRWLAVLAPHLWALRHRLWVTMAIAYATGSVATLFVQRAIPAAAWSVSAVGLTSLTVFVGVGVCADMLLAAAAVRAVRRANRRGLFDRRERDAFLRKRHRPLLIIVSLVMGFWPLTLYPYLSLLIIADQLLH